MLPAAARWSSSSAAGRRTVSPTSRTTSESARSTNTVRQGSQQGEKERLEERSRNRKWKQKVVFEEMEAEEDDEDESYLRVSLNLTTAGVEGNTSSGVAGLLGGCRASGGQQYCRLGRNTQTR